MQKPPHQTESDTTKPQTPVQLVKGFARELWDDHHFWVNTIAMKSGAGAVILAGVFGVGYVVSLPLVVAATGLLACTGLVGFGIFGMVAGANEAWRKIKDTYYKVTGKEAPPLNPSRKKKVFDRWRQNKTVQKILAHPWAQKMRKTRVWRMATRFRQKEEALLGGLAMGGSVVYAAIGGWLLFTQMLALPVIAVGGLLTVATVTAATYLASGISGIYFSAQALIDRRRKSKGEAAQAAKAVDEAKRASQTQHLSPVENQTPMAATLNADFDRARGSAADSANASPMQGNTAPPKPPKAA